MTSLQITIAVLVVEIALFALCVLAARRPIDPLRPRLMPYTLIMILLFVAIRATTAHIISLMTGHQLMPRRGKGMR